MDTAESLEKSPSVPNSAAWNRIKINKEERFHFFQSVAPEEDSVGQGLPELTADFKRYFTMPTGEVYFRLESARRRTIFKDPYLQHFASRFHAFQSRVALPEEHFSDPRP